MRARERARGRATLGVCTRPAHAGEHPPRGTECVARALPSAVDAPLPLDLTVEDEKLGSVHARVSGLTASGVTRRLARAVAGDGAAAAKPSPEGAEAEAATRGGASAGALVVSTQI